MMSKKPGLLIVVLLLIVPLAMSACGGSKKDNAKTADLKQEFESRFGVTVKYPDGWVAQDGESGVEIANKADYLTVGGNVEVPDDVVAVLVMPPFDPTEMGLAADASVKDVVNMVVQGISSEGSNTTVGDAKDVKVGSRDAVRVDIANSTAKSEGFFIGFKVDDTHFLMAGVGTHAGELSKNEATAMKIIESITYTPPAQ
jgi:hypothetical protein